ncbi:MAG TPA: hypothetical protein PK569_03425 [Thermoanaerobaculia bacterium]|nr:hypothetical protein [Thermoanaerobaculia bacterium]
MSGTVPVLAAAATNAVFAATLLLGLLFLGAATVPRHLRPSDGPTRFAAFLSLGASLFGATTWVAGALVGTRAFGPLWVALGLLALLGGARSGLSLLARLARRLTALLRASPLLSAALAVAALPLAFPLSIPLVDNDGIRYHVALPKLYLLTGEVFLYRWDVTGAYPQLGNMLALAGLAAGRADVAKFVNAGFLAASAALLALALHRGRASRAASLAGPLLLLAAPVVGVVAGSGFIDHVALFHLAAALVLVSRNGSPLLSGLALGAALATKLTLAPGAVAVGLAAALLRPRGERWRAFLVVPAAAAAVLAPFAIRNALALGDPFYPVLTLAAGRPTPGVSRTVFTHFTSFNAGNAGPLGIVWTTPSSGADDETAGIHNVAGLVLLLFGFRDRLVRLASLLVLPFLAYAALSAPPTRYLLPLLWGLSLVAAAVLGRLREGRLAWLAIPLALPGLVLSWSYQARNFGAADYLLGRVSREELLARTVPGYRATSFVNGLPPGGVMAADLPGPLYLDRPWIVSGFINEAPLTLWIREGDDSDRLLGRLREHGIRWLLATPGYGGGTPLSLLPYAPDPSKGHVMAALRAKLRLVATVDGVDVWEVPGATSARP